MKYGNVTVYEKRKYPFDEWKLVISGHPLIEAFRILLRFSDYEPKNIRVIDDLGVEVPHTIVVRVMNSQVRAYYDLPNYLKRTSSFSKKHFRKLPVPYISSHCRGHYYRSPSHHQARREMSRNPDEYGFRMKSRCHNRFVPTSWDDPIRSTRGARNWKRYRKTQYKN